MEQNELGDIIKDFLIESNENLARLEQEMVDLEQRPGDLDLLNSIFRTIHTIKGTCGFLNLGILEEVTHVAETLLNQLRNGERPLTPHLVSLILETVDAVKTILSTIEATGGEGETRFEQLQGRLAHAVDHLDAEGPATAPAAAAPAAVAAPEPAAAPVSDAGRSSATPAPLGVAPAPAPPPSARVPTEAVTAPPAPAADPAAPQVEAAAAKGPSIADSTIRVDVGLLDKLMNLVGELVLARNQILQFSAQREEAALTATSQRLNLITTQIQEGVMKTRMQPIGMVWNKLPRVVRDLAQAVGKKIQVTMDGAETELDKSIIEAIKDPLTHIVRNSCDHGIEAPEVRTLRGKPAVGTLSLRAFHEGGQVNIEVSDDGAGIDTQRLKEKAAQKGLLRPEQAATLSEREALDLVFHPGLSTAPQVTNISGRGVGMDVVKTNIEKIGGQVDLTSRVGDGTTVKIKIPLTLAIIPGLVVQSGGERFIIPQVSLLELLRLDGDAGRAQIERIKGTPVYRRRGQLLPIAYLNEVLHLTKTADSDAVNIVVLQAEDRQFGLVVDAIADTQEIVVKPLGKQLKGLNGYAGATIMGDGHVALILDVLGLGELSGVLAAAHAATRADESHAEAATAHLQSFLVFRAGSFERLAVPLSLVARLEEFPRDRLEQGSGRHVIQYRGQILTLVPLLDVLQPGRATAVDLPDPVPVVVFGHGEQVIGVIVDQIVDIVDDAAVMKKRARGVGLAGSAVIGGKVTDFLDLQAVLRVAEQTWFAASTAVTGGTVLLAEGSAFARGLMHNYLEMAGHTVIDASDAHEAIDRLERERVDAILAALDLPPHGGFALLAQTRGSEKARSVPALGLVSGTDRATWPGPAEGGFQDYLPKCDREALLASIDRVLSQKTAPPLEAMAPALVGGRS